MKAMNSYAVNEQPDYNKMVALHAPLVKRIAYHLMGRLPSSVQMDDLVQAGMIGLFEAIKGYDMTQGASFETYARIRVQGAMIDEVRRGDWTPRSVYRKARDISEAIRKVEDREGRSAKDREVADEMDLNLDEYYKLLQDSSGCQVLSYEEMTVEDHDRKEAESVNKDADPLNELQNTAFRKGLAEQIARLPEREKLVMSLYYEEELNMREIGAVLDVTEGRVCQIHSQALNRLRGRMRDWTEEED